MKTLVLLSRTRSVLRRVYDSSTFADLDPDSRSHIVFLDPDVDEQMGRPELITVTIEPGDQLNS